MFVPECGILYEESMPPSRGVWFNLNWKCSSFTSLSSPESSSAENIFTTKQKPYPVGKVPVTLFRLSYEHRDERERQTVLTYIL